MSADSTDIAAPTPAAAAWRRTGDSCEHRLEVVAEAVVPAEHVGNAEEADQRRRPDASTISGIVIERGDSWIAEAPPWWPSSAEPRYAPPNARKIRRKT